MRFPSGYLGFPGLRGVVAPGTYRYVSHFLTLIFQNAVFSTRLYVQEMRCFRLLRLEVQCHGKASPVVQMVPSAASAVSSGHRGLGTGPPRISKRCLSEVSMTQIRSCWARWRHSRRGLRSQQRLYLDPPLFIQLQLVEPGFVPQGVGNRSA